MHEIPQQEQQAIWEEVRREFPEDRMMQELHYLRRLHALQTRGMSAAEEIAFYESAGQRASSDR